MLKFFKKTKKDDTCANPVTEEIKVTERKEASAIINGLLYDTSKAKFLGHVYDYENHSWEGSDLYVTKNERYFYVEPWGTITPTSPEFAKRSVYGAFGIEKCKEIFGEIREA